MADNALVLTPEEVLHKQFMLSILKSVADTPLVLKGGTALMLAYELDRFSEDLDFDAPHKLNLVSKITHSARHGISLEKIDILKDTGTVTRYRIRYKTKEGSRSLKMEISYRTIPSDSDVEIYNGIRVYSIATIFNQKLLAAHDGEKPRTVIRDLYDIDFIVRKFSNKLSREYVIRLMAFSANPDELISRYKQAYEEDGLVQGRAPLDELVIGLHYSVIELGKNSP